MSSDEAFLVELLTALASTRLEALVVGSTAGVLQGAPVMTQDVDLLIRDTPANRKKLARLAEALGASTLRVSELSSSVTLVGGAVPVDVLFDRLPGRGHGFAALMERRVSVKLGDQRANVLGLEDLISSKEASARPKDLAQLPILRETLRVLRERAR